ncbi:MAG: HPr family phosphocarrier protein [Myxococcota bacterium]|jgi:phosphotransferase system HPr (HPr) family protein|nr:HPr family phosphocarrier protein [Myxococcota bacterium]
MSDEVEREFVVGSPLGMHARPAGRFVALVSGFESEISVGKNDEWVNGASVLSILSLAAAQGTPLRIRAVGTDAERAVSELGALVEADEEVPSGGGG